MDVDRGVTGRQPQAVRSALEVLEAVAGAGPGVTAGELAEELGLPPATTYRLLNLLVGEEWLVRLPDLHGFALGARVEGLLGAGTPVAPPAAARAVLAQARGRVRAGVHLVRYGARSLKVVDVDPDLPLGAVALVERHLHASAAGRLLLAAVPDWQLLPGTARLAAVTPATVTRVHRLDLLLDEVRAQGWAGQSGELHVGVACLAVPVLDSAGGLVAAVAISSPRGEVPVECLDAAQACAAELAPLLS